MVMVLNEKTYFDRQMGKIFPFIHIKVIFLRDQRKNCFKELRQ